METYYLKGSGKGGEKYQEKITIRPGDPIPEGEDLKTKRHYMAPDTNDLKREEKVLELLNERFQNWQHYGYVPSARIPEGDKTEEPKRTRGWTYWHHLFHPRQLLMLGDFLFSYYEGISADTKLVSGACISAHCVSDRQSMLCGVDPHISKGPGSTNHVFLNQALNTQYIFGIRSFSNTKEFFITNFLSNSKITSTNLIEPSDARAVTYNCDLWITDPPYADAINYHEIGDFFLSWYHKQILKYFPIWYSDSHSALAVQGADQDFNLSMVDSYTNLVNHMPENGVQVVMFTHQNSKVWADLAMILWASGLRVQSAWTIQTETGASGLKKGNYVQGTVIMVLRKQTSSDLAFLSDIQADVEYEVKTQLAYMTELDDQEDPNFGDSDYQLAAYAAALRVLTSFKQIQDIDIQYELTKERTAGERNKIQEIIDSAVSVACDHLVPFGLDQALWRQLNPEERFYIKGLEVQSHQEYRSGVYQEFARGFGVKDYARFLNSGKANETRLMTPIEFGNKELSDDGFGKSLVRNTLFAVRETHKDESPHAGRMWLYNELPDYWGNRQRILQLLDYLDKNCRGLEYWEKDVEAAHLLKGYLENDHV